MSGSAPSAAVGVDALRVDNIAKRFGAVVALREVTLNLRQGEVLALVGDNGAGKSTLIKILTGFLQPDSGTIAVNGEEVRLRSVDHARSLGIDTVYQDLALVPGLSVHHNMFLKRELVKGIGPFKWLDNRQMRKRAREYLDNIGIGTLRSVDAEVALLSGGQRQAIALARTAYSGARILLLDEPLAAMGAREGKLILDLIRQLKQRGDISMILIAHNYVHVFDVADRVNLLRNGRITYDKPTSESSVDELTEIVASEYRAKVLDAPEPDVADGPPDAS
jgi:simple sugar transport system ATP-binding protein